METGDDLAVTTELPPVIADESAYLDSLTTTVPGVVEVERHRRTLRASVAEVRSHLGRLVRYSVTSVVALGVSEATLLVLYSTRTFGATTAALLANLVGTVPSYLLSRYWIWRHADRRRVGRQLVLYWLISAISMAITSLATGAITEAAPTGHRAHVIVAGVGFLAVSVFLWVAKYVVYQKLVFANGRGSAPATS